MRQRHLRSAIAHGLIGVALAACTVPNKNKRKDASVDDTVDASTDAPQPDALVGPLCTANQALRCEGNLLVRCNANGDAEVSESCSLGCIATSPHCADIMPSNNLAKFLDHASGQADLNLGESATINADNGDVVVDGVPVGAKSETLAQAGAPTIRVFIVRSLSAKNVNVTGKNAVSIVSNSDIRINGVFTVSAKAEVPGPGSLNDGVCKGQDGVDNTLIQARGGNGGGGFGNSGGSGGPAIMPGGSQTGAKGGDVAGNAWLEPLRGGCDGGGAQVNYGGGGGGAIQLVSRTQIVVSGVVAANGGGAISRFSYSTGGGGSGGGVLLEAPIVDVSGRVVANGGGGAGCRSGSDGRLDGDPATGFGGCVVRMSGVEIKVVGTGGNGGSGNSSGMNGTFAQGSAGKDAVGGSGGGGVGRIRVNTAPGGQRTSGAYSPTPTSGALTTR